jgi:hypothetical protein
VTIGPLVLFSTAGGDAWLLDPADHLATRIAQDGDPLPVHIEETKPRVAERDAGAASTSSSRRMGTAREPPEGTLDLGRGTR